MTGLSTLIVGLLASLLFFLIFRIVVLWYWRVNECVALLKSIDGSLRVVAGVASSPEAR